MLSLAGKTALITGASRGIGESAARIMAAQGASVVLAARSLDQIDNHAQQIRAAGGKAEVVACDVARYDDVQKAVQLCIDRFGGLDILVNNAGLIDPINRLEASTPKDWGHVLDVNVKGVYHGLHAAAACMLGQKSGTIINISSGAATSALEGWSHYCASKAAVLSLTRCADLEWREHGIRVMGLSPGTVATHMQVAIKQSGINPVSKLEISDHIPADWVGHAIAWLAGPAGDTYRGTDCSLRDEGVRRSIGLTSES